MVQTMQAPAATPMIGARMPASEDLSTWRPSATDPWDHAKAAHLLRRAGFGGRPEEIDAVVALGADRAIDLLLTTPYHPVPTHGTVVLPGGEVLNLGTLAGQRAMLAYTQANTPYPLQEKLTLFWLDHFSVGLPAAAYPEPMGLHAQTLRALAMGRFRDLLIAVTLDPAMMLWLDNRLNRRGNPNENYARELFELYSMGVHGGYTERDVQEAARALTGHVLGARNLHAFSLARHDAGAKVVLGRTISNGNAPMRDLEDLVDIILGHPSTSRYMVRKVWEFFVYEEPSAAVVDRLAEQWARDGYELRPLMSTILRSRAFYSQASVRKLVKNPVELVAGLIRILGSPQLLYDGAARAAVAQGWPLLNHVDPSGQPDGIAWITSQSLIERSNYAQVFIQRSNNTTNRFVRAQFDPHREINRAGLRTAEQIVDHYLRYMVDGLVPKAVRDNLLFYMDNIDSGSRPFNVANATHVNDKVSGLVHLIAALPEYQMN